jgi:Caspase domain
MSSDLLNGIRSGSVRLLCRALLWLLVGLSPATAQIPEDIQQLLQHRGHALLIGVSNYTNGWDKLLSVEDDLQNIKEGLKPYFETVDIVQSPTVAELRTKMRGFLLVQWNKPQERLFIYYSGHGFTDFNQYSRQKDGYITGSDTPPYHESDGMAVANAVPFTEINAWSLLSHARHVLMVFDSCFSGSLFQTKATITEPSWNAREDVRRMLGLPIRYYITAGRQNQQVAANSTFSRLLLRGLRGDADLLHEGIISADELGIYLSREVPRLSQGSQTPQFNSIDSYENEEQFFFLTPPAAPRVKPSVVTYPSSSPELHVEPELRAPRAGIDCNIEPPHTGNLVNDADQATKWGATCLQYNPHSGIDCAQPPAYKKDDWPQTREWAEQWGVACLHSPPTPTLHAKIDCNIEPQHTGNFVNDTDQATSWGAACLQYNLHSGIDCAQPPAYKKNDWPQTRDWAEQWGVACLQRAAK